MKNYEILGLDHQPDADPVAVDVETYYDRHERSWVSYLVDADGAQVGDAQYDGTRADRDASIAALRRRTGEAR